MGTRIIGEDDIGPIFSDETEDEEKDRARAIKRNGGPAFPQNDLTGYGMGPSEIGNGGMSLRDWFAGQALITVYQNSPDHTTLESIAAEAYQIADAMLAERERK